uniref:Variant surface glycoprotein 1125.1682 n=1 Tax=Trypanosoma brucei TaxID=5691 RepID=A0A1J0R7H9_9TRYP|nr:variant surface glycoprotein 1125.1682 [Trypanosoma brucei]
MTKISPACNLLILVFIGMWFDAKPLEANLAGGENRREHEVLCKFVAMTDATPVLPPEPADAEDEYRLIQALNLSTSPDDWQNMLYENKADKKVHDTPEKAGKTDRGFEGDWADWKQAAQDILPDSGYTKIHDIKLQDLKPFQKMEAANAIRAIAARAKQLKAELEQLTPDEKALSTSEITKKLKIAAFGTHERDRAAVTLTDVFGADPGASHQRSAVCNAGATPAGPQTALATLSCVCTKATTSASAPNNPACDKKADGGSGWNSGSGANQPPIADIRALAQSCGKGTGTVTADNIAQAVEELLHLVRVDSADGYIGTRLSGDCNGGSGTGICVKLTGYTANPATTINKLQWLSNLKQLAATLNSRQSKHTANQNKAAELKRAAAQAVQIAKEAKSLTISAINTKKAAADEEATAISNRACENHTTNATCGTDNNCKWTSTDKSDGDLCKSKDGEGQTNAETGTGVRAAGTTTKKFNGKLETDCDEALG